MVQLEFAVQAGVELPETRYFCYNFQERYLTSKSIAQLEISLHTPGIDIFSTNPGYVSIYIYYIYIYTYAYTVYIVVVHVINT